MKVVYTITRDEARALIREFAPKGAKVVESDMYFDKEDRFGVKSSGQPFVSTSPDLLNIRVSDTVLPDWVKRLVEKVEAITKREVTVSLNYTHKLVTE